MSKLYEYIVENTTSGNIDMEVAVNIIKLLKKEEAKPWEDIAIIGMGARFPTADNAEEFWEKVRNGTDFITEFPASRRNDADKILRALNTRKKKVEYDVGAFFEEIDKFDYNFFQLSPKEASLFDPNQKLFLQTAWNAIEDAGYGGQKIRGTKTGVYVGYSTDFGANYKDYIGVTETTSKGLAVAGNINSIIGSRISYILDLKGPSIMVDTACSSSLVAIYLACLGISSEECDMAIAGGVKINIVPIKRDADLRIGIESSDGKAKTFDDSSDGTGMGEGVAAILLKPLKKALADGDNIYAVIKGGEINQDGYSIGLTAPNSMSQKDAILKAWQVAGVNPETITYVEAHGTGTKLGDPIEIDGLEMAFSKHTKRKQFCAIGSVKTNIGHLDNAAGIAGLVKAVLALKHREIPPTLHFKRPNRKICFENSPVYVNDRLKMWETEGGPRRCGINSFGLSGTNCHIVLEEAPSAECNSVKKKSSHILTMSAKSERALGELLKQYFEIVQHEDLPDIENICYTANTGRGHYNCRLAVIAGNASEFKEKIAAVYKAGLDCIKADGIYYGRHEIIPVNVNKTDNQQITHAEKNQMDSTADASLDELLAAGIDNTEPCFDEILRLYIKGADVNWEKLYRGRNIRKVSLPVYPFERKRCWLEEESDETEISRDNVKEILHPLLENHLTDSFDCKIFYTRFSVKKLWVISEHKIVGRYVVPGTAYLEMINKVFNISHPDKDIEICDIFFLKPMSIDLNEIREVHTIIKEKGESYEFIIASRTESENVWSKHAEGNVSLREKKKRTGIDIDDIKSRYSVKNDIPEEPRTKAVETGPRWDCIREIYLEGNEALVYLELPEDYMKDLEDYKLHPSLMDCAVNLGMNSTGEGLYLPYSYRNIKIYGPMPAIIYSHIKRRKLEKEDPEVSTFDITLMDENGIAFVEIEGYSIKKINRDEQLRLAGNMYYEMAWVPAKQPDELKIPEGARILVLKGGTPVSLEMVQQLREKGVVVIEVDTGREYERKAEDRFVISETEEDYARLLNDVKEKGLWKVIHLSTLTGREEIADEDMLEDSQKKGVYSLFYLTRGFLNSKMRNDLEIILVSDYTAEVTGCEERINPHNASLFGLGKVISNEYEHLECRCIDIAEKTGTGDIISEIMSGTGAHKIALRNGTRYKEEFRRMDISETARVEAEIKEDGVYVITGGTGGIGLEIGKYLASKNKVKLCLVNRSSMPEREEWGNILERSVDVKECRKIKAIRYMEDRGTEVNCYSADVSDMEKMRKVLEDIRSRYGKIDGVIHGAGIAGDGFIIRKDEEVFSRVMKPKVQGTWILDRLTKDDKLDFFIMFSSIEALIGNMGQGDYTSANCYLDAFSGYRRKNGKRSLTINWPAWKETGMAADYGATGARGLFKPIATDRAIRCFEDVITRDTGKVVIGELDYEAMGTLADDKQDMELSEELKTAIRKIRSNSNVGGSTGSEKTLTRVVLKGKDENGYNEIEIKVAEVWAQVLGIEEINAYDSFRDIGGDSILATHLLKKMEQVFPGILDISDIFTYGTVSELAGYIESKLGKKEDTAGEMDTQGIMDLLSKGEISMEEADSLIGILRN